MRNALHTRPADDTPYREDLTRHQRSEERLKTFRLFEGMDEPEPTRSGNWAAAAVFLAVIFAVMLCGAIFALKFGGWV
jgi:hypothetical protein